MATEITITRPVPSFLLRKLLASEEIIVEPAIIIVIIPAYPTGTPRTSNIEGQAAPKTESGKPSEIKAI